MVLVLKLNSKQMLLTMFKIIQKRIPLQSYYKLSKNIFDKHKSKYIISSKYCSTLNKNIINHSPDNKLATKENIGNLLNYKPSDKLFQIFVSIN